MGYPIKLLFGLRLTTTTTLKVEGVTPDDPPSPLTLEKENVSPWTVAYDAQNNRWQTELSAGDYTVSLRLPVDAWIEGVCQFTLSANGKVVYHWNNWGADPMTTIAWTTMAGTGGNPTGEDEKDPWPPPGVDEGIDSASWMLLRLKALGEDIDNPRSGPPA